MGGKWCECCLIYKLRVTFLKQVPFINSLRALKGPNAFLVIETTILIFSYVQKIGLSIPFKDLYPVISPTTEFEHYKAFLYSIMSFEQMKEILKIASFTIHVQTPCLHVPGL